MSPQPIRKSQALLDEIHSITKDQVSDTVLMRRLFKSANELKKTDAHDAYHALGLLYMNQRKCEQSLENFAAAIKLGENEIILHNYGVALGEFGQYSDAWLMFKRAYERSRSLEALIAFMESSALSGRIYFASDLLEKLAKVKPGAYPGIIDIENAKSVMRAHGIDEQIAIDRVHAAEELLLKNNFTHSRPFLYTNIDEESGIANIDFEVFNATLDEIMELNFQLIELYAARPEYSDSAAGFVVTFSGHDYNH